MRYAGVNKCDMLAFALAGTGRTYDWAVTQTVVLGTPTTVQDQKLILQRYFLQFEAPD